MYLAPIPDSDDNIKWLAMSDADFDDLLSKPTRQSSSYYDKCSFSQQAGCSWTDEKPVYLATGLVPERLKPHLPA